MIVEKQVTTLRTPLDRGTMSEIAIVANHPFTGGTFAAAASLRDLSQFNVDRDFNSWIARSRLRPVKS